MNRLIDADALMKIYRDRVDKVIDRYGFHSSEHGILSGAMKLLEEQPTIEERKTGKWIAIKKGELGYSVGDFRCTACEQPCPCYHLTPYCPNCGAKMEGKG